MKKLIYFICICLVSVQSFAQSDQKDLGNIHLHFGTLMVYTTYSAGYEGFDFLKQNEKHQVRPLIRFGGWKSSFSDQNSGTQSALGVSYLFGKGNHKFEHSSELVFHFSKGLKGQPIVYVANLYRPYIGYRFQPVNKKFIAKVGFGWKEVLQLGIGYRL